MSIVLGGLHLEARALILHHGDGGVLFQVVGTNDDAAGVNARLAHGALQFGSIAEHAGEAGVGSVEHLLHLGQVFYAVFEVDLGSLALGVLNGVGELIGHQSGHVLYHAEGHVLHTPHVGYGALGGHGAKGDDVGHGVGTVFVCHPFYYLLSTIVGKVGIDIGEGYTVGVEETLEQQVVLHGVYVRDAQAIGHHGARCRTTSGAYPDIQFLARGTDEVHHNKEVARETHGLHNVELEGNLLHLSLGELLAIAAVGTLPCQFGQIVGLQLNAVEFVVATEFLDLLLGIGLFQNHLVLLVLGKLIEEVLLG